MLSLIWNSTLILASLSLFYTFGQTFYSQKLVAPTSQPFLRFMFASLFALCLCVFELVIFEILDVMPRNLRRWWWRLSLWLILGVLCVVIPVYALVLLFARRDSGIVSLRHRGQSSSQSAPLACVVGNDGCTTTLEQLESC